MPYSFDEQQAPLISMRVHGWLTHADFTRLLADLDRLDARGRPFAVVLDCCGLRAPEIGHVRQLRRFLAGPATASKHYRGLACVADTPLLRGTLGAVVQGRPTGVPTVIVDDPEAARAWARSHVLEQPLEPPRFRGLGSKPPGARSLRLAARQDSARSA